MKAFLDGNALCIVRNDYRGDLQKDEAVFIELDVETLKEIKQMGLQEAEQLKAKAECTIENYSK